MKPIRQLSPIGTYFVTASTWSKRPLFMAEPFATLLIDVLYEYRRQLRYELHAFVLMPDHFHLLITRELGITLERAAQYIKGGLSFRAGKVLGFRGYIWERGFTDHRMRDDADFNLHKAYIHMNPVKRGLVTNAAGYRCGSASGNFECDVWPSAAKAAMGVAVGRHG